MVRIWSTEGLGSVSGGVFGTDEMVDGDTVRGGVVHFDDKSDKKYTSDHIYRCYTVSQESGGNFDETRHYSGDFCDRKFVLSLRRKLMSVSVNSLPRVERIGEKPHRFHQIHLDYFWSPSGTWMEEHWGTQFFQSTLVQFLTEGVLHDMYEEDRRRLSEERYKLEGARISCKPSSKRKSLSQFPRSSSPNTTTPPRYSTSSPSPSPTPSLQRTEWDGVSDLYGIYLPFCTHILRQLVNPPTYRKLSEVYTIEFCTKDRDSNNEPIGEESSSLEEGRAGEEVDKVPSNLQKARFGNSLLHLGTQEIRPIIMQQVFEKELNQEEKYCGMRRGVSELMNSGDQSVDVKLVKGVYSRIKEADKVKFVVLRPKPTDHVGGFIGLHPVDVLKKNKSPKLHISPISTQSSNSATVKGNQPPPPKKLPSLMRPRWSVEFRGVDPKSFRRLYLFKHTHQTIVDFQGKRVKREKLKSLLSSAAKRTTNSETSPTTQSIKRKLPVKNEALSPRKKGGPKMQQILPKFNIRAEVTRLTPKKAKATKKSKCYLVRSVEFDAVRECYLYDLEPKEIYDTFLKNVPEADLESTNERLSPKKTSQDSASSGESPPKRKVGRPPKKKTNNDLPQKRKRGRPPKKKTNSDLPQKRNGNAPPPDNPEHGRVVVKKTPRTTDPVAECEKNDQRAESAPVEPLPALIPPFTRNVKPPSPETSTMGRETTRTIFSDIVDPDESNSKIKTHEKVFFSFVDAMAHALDFNDDEAEYRGQIDDETDAVDRSERCWRGLLKSFLCEYEETMLDDTPEADLVRDHTKGEETYDHGHHCGWLERPNPGTVGGVIACASLGVGVCKKVRWRASSSENYTSSIDLENVNTLRVCLHLI